MRMDQKPWALKEGITTISFISDDASDYYWYWRNNNGEDYSEEKFERLLFANKVRFEFKEVSDDSYNSFTK